MLTTETLTKFTKECKNKNYDLRTINMEYLEDLMDDLEMAESNRNYAREMAKFCSDSSIEQAARAISKAERLKGEKDPIYGEFLHDLRKILKEVR